MFARIFSGLVVAVVVIILFLMCGSFPNVFTILFTLASVISVHEVFSAMGLSKRYRIYIPSILFAFFVPLADRGAFQDLTWYLYTLSIFGFIILFNGEISEKMVMMAYGLTILVVKSLRLLIDIGYGYDGKIAGFYKLLALCTAWFADTGAYFFGMLWGKTKLCEKVSPKKTVEGAIGGIIFCFIFLNLLALMFEKFIFLEKLRINYHLIIFISIVGSIISVIGDLSFSTIKRKFKVKDFGNIIPGHGGILDRFDSVIFVAPFIYVVLSFVPLVK